MLLIIFLGLIAKLALVSYACDVGTQDVKNFNFPKFAGNRTWHVILHSSNAFDNNIACADATYSIPNGNTSLSAIDLYIMSAQQYITINGTATNWNSNGYYEVYQSGRKYGYKCLTKIDLASPGQSMLSGKYYVIATDYAHYTIVKVCPFALNTTDVYVGFRSVQPQKGIWNKVMKELQDNNIDGSQLVKRRADNCQQA